MTTNVKRFSSGGL